jgi:hypothetical protein
VRVANATPDAANGAKANTVNAPDAAATSNCNPRARVIERA